LERKLIEAAEILEREIEGATNVYRAGS